jgi:ankyrin repeat protein
MIINEISSTRIYTTVINMARVYHSFHDIFFPILMRRAVRHHLHIRWMVLLHWASSRGYTRVVKGLLDAGENVNRTDHDGISALMWASRYGHEGVVECLIAHGAELNIHARVNPEVFLEKEVRKYPNSQIALTLAVQFGHLVVLNVLFQHGAVFDRRHWWTILVAARRDDLDVAKVLLDRGADPNFRLRDSICGGRTFQAFERLNWGDTAAYLAVKHHHPAMLAFLLENGADDDRQAHLLLQNRLSRLSFSKSDERCLYELCGRSWWRKTRWKWQRDFY